MPLHPEFEALVQQMAEAGGPLITDLAPDDARALYRAMQPVLPDLHVGAVADRTVPGPAGEIPVRLYTPEGQGPHPLIVYFHGGGWVIGDLDTHDAVCRDLCTGAAAVVLAVDYRLAPEHRFPAAVEDCVAATRWARDHAAEIDADATRMAVAGDSAGGNLAAVVAQQLANDSGPELRFQLLVYPITDAACETDSYRVHGDGAMLSADTMHWFWDHYAPENAQRLDPRASPLRAEDLRGLPPALVITAEYDPLCDEGEAYGRALKAAGVPTEIERYDGMPHGFFAMARMIPCGRPALERACAALRRALA